MTNKEEWDLFDQARFKHRIKNGAYQWIILLDELCFISLN